MNTSPDHESHPDNQIPADRNIPSVAAAPKSRTVVMAVLLGFATLAILFVVIDGMRKSAPTSLVTAEEITFKGPGTASVPYIEAVEPATSPEPQETKAVETTAPQVSEMERLMQAEALRLAKEQQKRKDERLRSPQLIIDKSASNQAYAASNTPAGGDLMSAGDSNTAFANQYGTMDVETAQAAQIENLSTLIAQGTMIPGILETAIQSDLPGMVRAIVSEPVYSHDGTHILIPKGARLIGRYRAGLVRGQSRVFVIWNRVLRQDGVSVNIGSMGTDDLGRSGLAGELDTHFFERFGSSILLSLIDAGLQMGVNSLDDQNSATVALESGSDFSKSAEMALENSIDIAPTINVDQGVKIKVFVAKDLDFSQVTGNIARR